MDASRAIWVETSSFDASESAEPDLFPRLQQRMLWRGVFACQVYFRPFEELDRFRHGFNLDTLLNEALDRLKRFIETQHFPGQVDDAFIPYSQRRALALRCVNCAEPGRLTLVVMGRVYGAGEEEARENGRRACREICSIFPYDYQVVPIETGDEFERLTGAQVIRSLLETCGIKSLMQGNAAVSVQPFVMDGMGEIKIMVVETQAEEARKIIEANADV